MVDPLSVIMAGSMAADLVARPLSKLRENKDLAKDIAAARVRLDKDESITSNPYINQIREDKNKTIERRALDIEAKKGKFYG